MRKCVTEMWEGKEGSRGIHKRRAPLPAAEKEKNLFWKMKKKPGFFGKKLVLKKVFLLLLLLSRDPKCSLSIDKSVQHAS